jgi:hypothetical protein
VAPIYAIGRLLSGETPIIDPATGSLNPSAIPDALQAAGVPMAGGAIGVPKGGTVLGAGAVRRTRQRPMYTTEGEPAPAPPPKGHNKPPVETPQMVAVPAKGKTAGDTAAEAVQAPAILSRQEPTAEDVASIKSAAKGYGRKGWPDAEREVFKTTPEAYAETTQLVPQVSIKNRLPGPLPGEKLPLNERAAPIVANTDEISNRIAERLQPMVKEQSPLLKFYHTGPVIRGLEQYAGLDIPGANAFMRDWAGQGAATSPRTQTPPNLRNSSYLLYERARGNPLTPERFDVQGNIPGYPMMGMHVDFADKFARGAENPWTNPKPTAFREAWSGNLRDVTGDTHNIRSTLYEMDQIQPGSLPRGWFTSDAAYAKYRSEGFRAVDPGDIADTLGGKTVQKIPRQSEYLPMVEPWYQAAQKVGIHPAEGQSGGWFSYGGITGLQSPPKTITNLLNDQISATAKALGVPPERVVEWWAKGKIPLAGLAGTLGAAGLAGSGTPADAASQMVTEEDR